MELRSSRWRNALLGLPVALVLWPMIATALFDAPLFGDRLFPLVLLGAPVLTYLCVPTRIVARIEGTQVWIGSKTARITDLIGIEVQTIRVNLIPASRHMFFSFRAQSDDGFFARKSGIRKFVLVVDNVTGGRKAAEAFAAQLTAIAKGEPVTPAPQPAIAPAAAPHARPSVELQGQDPDFDPDAIMERYLAGRQEALTGSPRPAARPGFGRKGL